MQHKQTPLLTPRLCDEQPEASPKHISDEMYIHNSTQTTINNSQKLNACQRTFRTKPLFECPQQVQDPGSPMKPSQSPQKKQLAQCTTTPNRLRSLKLKSRTPQRCFLDSPKCRTPPTKGILKQRSIVPLKNCSQLQNQKRVIFDLQRSQQPLIARPFLWFNYF